MTNKANPTMNELIAIHEIENEARREAALSDYFLRVYEANNATESEAAQSVTIEVTTAEAAKIKPVNKHLYGNMSEQDANKLARFLTSPIKKPRPMTHTIMDSHRAARIEREYWRGVNGLHYGTMLNRSTP